MRHESETSQCSIPAVLCEGALESSVLAKLLLQLVSYGSVLHAHPLAHESRGRGRCRSISRWYEEETDAETNEWKQSVPTSATARFSWLEMAGLIRHNFSNSTLYSAILPSPTSHAALGRFPRAASYRVYMDLAISKD